VSRPLGWQPATVEDS